MNTLRTVVAGLGLLASVTAFAQDPAPAAEATTAAPATVPAAPAQAAGTLSYTDDYRITVNHAADSDGTIVFQVVTEKVGSSHDITVPIKKGTSENDVARAIKTAFKEQLGTKNFDIEGDDGESIVIEGRGGKRYSLVLASTSVNGVKVSIEHD